MLSDSKLSLGTALHYCTKADGVFALTKKGKVQYKDFQQHDEAALIQTILSLKLLTKRNQNKRLAIFIKFTKKKMETKYKQPTTLSTGGD